MTIKATLSAAMPEAKRIAAFLERDFGDDDVPVALVEAPDGHITVEAYFPDGDAETIARAICDKLGTDAFTAPLDVVALPETDWVALSLHGLNPVTAGRFVVHGAHDRAAARRGRIAIEIDAGQAFGTGHHGTTAGCLAAIDHLCRARRFERPLDLGTGSGVLAIALAKILGTRVLATDIDPVACRVAAENAAINRVGRLVDVIVADGVRHKAVRGAAPFDFVVANILAEPLRRLAPRLAPLIAPCGVLVLSGLLPQQRDRVAAAYRAQGLRLVNSCIVDGWSVVTMARVR